MPDSHSLGISENLIQLNIVMKCIGRFTAQLHRDDGCSARAAKVMAYLLTLFEITIRDAGDQRCA